MEQLILVTVAGLAASLVDGALGMGFGPTSSSLLLAAGLAPAAVALTVNLAKIATGAAGGYAHWRAGNVERHIVAHLAVPGMIGAVLGGLALQRVAATNVRPFMSVLLVLVSVRMLWRMSAPERPSEPLAPTPTGPALSRADHRLALIGFVGGITNGMIGAWGPIVTPILMTRRDISPRTAVGSANAAEFAVALVSVTTLVGASRGQSVDVPILAALLIGGLAAAPLAAVVVKAVAPRVLGLAVGALLLGLNIGEVGDLIDPFATPFIAVTCAAAATAVVANLRRTRRERALDRIVTSR